jgi:hypothetical protein
MRLWLGEKHKCGSGASSDYNVPKFRKQIKDKISAVFFRRSSSICLVVVAILVFIRLFLKGIIYK